MIHPDHILWRLKQLLVNPKGAIVGRFKLAQKIGELEILYEPVQPDPEAGTKSCRSSADRRAPKTARAGFNPDPA
jgi:hypothetical protein